MLDLLDEPAALGRFDLITPDGAVVDPERAALRFVEEVLDAGGQVALLGYRQGAEGRLLAGRGAGMTLPLAFAVTRSRFPGLEDAELAAATGPAGRLVERPAPAVIVDYDPAGWEEHPVLSWQRLVDLLARHDAHLLAGDPAGGGAR